MFARIQADSRATRFITAVAVACVSSSVLVGCVDEPAKHRVQANAYLRRGDAENAVRECNEGLAARKDDVPLLILKGKALFEQNKLDEAKQSYQQAITAGQKLDDTALVEAHLGIGVVASRQEDWATAKSEFQTLIKVNDRDAYSHLNLARACLGLKDNACAIEHGEIAGKLRGNEENVLFTLGTIYLGADKTKEAELTFQHICEVIPGAATCPYGVALVAAKTGDKAKAIAQLTLAVDRKLPNPERLAKEPGFASIKDDPEFVKLVERAAQK
jgi:tetratricopeptide (TPR) repeat protein